ncbi:hypothetical protein CATYP_01880 [Corynebacterium atypicum]|uniref:DUF3068 domain-containing protein n=1 Tax=Corynebacterium atypicum TaxID=191610 RepID=A0ABM5QLJ0_9CORY|nr:DUF3068 domain-containing protein [Corynebacterium atypicum]AIG63630.1 hypothetical protein CATYP_01880 [Corynebacterium atypicum]
MLPKSRVVSALLVGLGVALVVAGLLAPRALPADTRLPLDLGQQTWTITDPHARTRLMTNPQGRVLDAPVTRQLHMTLEEPANEDTVSVRVGSTLARDSMQSDADRLIDAKVWNWRMDRLSGEPVGSAVLADQLASPTKNVEMGGVWLKFPANAERKNYDVFDETLRRAYPAEFAEEVEIAGRTIYRYHQHIDPQNVRAQYAHPFNEVELHQEGEGDGDGGDTATGYLFHSVSRDIFVDQATGLVVRLDEQVTDFYGRDAGDRAETVLEFSGTMPDEQVEALLDAASSADAARATGPVSWALIAGGAVVTVIGIAGAFGAFRSWRNRKA